MSNNPLITLLQILPIGNICNKKFLVNLTKSSSHHFFEIALFAVDNLWSVGRVRGLKGIRAALTHTLACPEFQGVALF